MADGISLSVRMGHFSCTDGTSSDGPWSVQAVQMADRIIISICMGHFSCTDGTSLDSPWSVELNPFIQYGKG